MSKMVNQTLMQWLVDFRQQKTTDSLESISAQIGISRSTLNIYLSQIVSDKKIGRNYKPTLLKLLKLNLSDNSSVLLEALEKNSQELFSVAFKKDFDFLRINKIEDIEKLNPANDKKYKLIFVTDYFKPSVFEVLEFSNGIIEIEDNNSSRRKIHLNEYHDPKISIQSKESVKQITITAIQFPKLEIDEVENYITAHSGLDGVYIGETDDDYIVSGKVRLIPEDNYSNIVKLGTILNREGRTPFIGKDTQEYSSSKYQGCYTNFYYKPRKGKIMDKIGVNKYLLINGKVFGMALRDGKLTFYVGSYYEYDNKLWIETFHANEDFDIPSDESVNKFALKSILEPSDTQNKMFTGHFLGYSATDYSISGFEFFYLDESINQFKDEILKNNNNPNEIIKQLLSRNIEPTLISVEDEKGQPQNFTSYRNNKSNLLENSRIKFLAETFNNNNKIIYPSKDLVGFNHFIKFLFEDINGVLDA